MARGLIEDLESPWPIGMQLPGMLRDDDFSARFASAFDTLVAPIHTTLDCLDAYFDPWLTPPDFLEWLAVWVAVELDELLPIDRQRLLVSEAVRLYRIRGTAIGLAEHVAIYTGHEVEIVESGGSTWSAAPGGAAPGESEPRLLVRVLANKADDIDLRRVEALVASAKPAHLPHTIEVVNESTGKVMASEGPAEAEVPASLAEVPGAPAHSTERHDEPAPAEAEVEQPPAADAVAEPESGEPPAGDEG